MERGNRKVLYGKVVSNKMDKTVAVAVENYFRHPLYNKATKLTKKYMAHDAENTCGVGDKVKIMETRPLSKSKRWRVLDVVEKAPIL